MAILSRLRTLWRNVVHRDRVERDLDDELRATFDLLVAEGVAAGRRPDDARRGAVLQMGRIESTKDRVRDVRAGALLQGIVQDLRYGTRVLRRNPLFALTAALSIAIGVGATTTIFTIANALLLRAAPGVAEPGRLVDLVPAVRGHFGVTFSTYAVYQDIRGRVTTLQDVWLILRQGMALVAIGTAIGLALAAAAGRMLSCLLFGVPSLDPVTFGGAVALFAAVGLAACYLPARRATRVSAIEALRYE